MTKVYKYLGVFWPSISDCEEMALSIYEEAVYNYATRRMTDSPNDWLERTENYAWMLRHRPKRHFDERILMN